jgi:hypothetical protein
MNAQMLTMASAFIHESTAGTTPAVDTATTAIKADQ